MSRTRAVIIIVGGLVLVTLFSHVANGQTVKPAKKTGVRHALMVVPRMTVKAAVVTATHQPVRGIVGSIVFTGGYVVDGVQAVANALDGGGTVAKHINPIHYVNVVVNKIDDGFDAAEQYYGGPTP